MNDNLAASLNPETSRDNDYAGGGEAGCDLSGGVEADTLRLKSVECASSENSLTANRSANVAEELRQSGSSAPPAQSLKRPPRKHAHTTKQGLTPRSSVNAGLDAWLEYFDAGRGEWTKQCLRRRIKRFRAQCGARQIRTITRDDLGQYVSEYLGAGMMGNGCHRAMVDLHGFFRWCVEDNLLDINPVQWTRIPKIPREARRRVPFTWDQYQRLMRFMETTSNPYYPFWDSACTIAWYTGMRCSDVAHLRWDLDENGMGSAVNFDEEIIVLRPIKRAKSRQLLQIPMERDLYVHLLQLREDTRIESIPWVLPFMHATYRQKRENLIRGFKLLMDTCGMPDHSFHSFRHGFVSRLICAGVTPLIIGSMTGQSEQQIKQYAHITTAAKINALAESRKALHDSHIKEMNLASDRGDAVRV